MTDNQPNQPSHELPATGRHQAEPYALANAGLVLGERAARNLIGMATAAGAMVTELDDDPTLRAAALTLGRGYRTVDLNVIDAQPDRPADLIVLRWPRPGDQLWLSTASEVFAGLHELLAPMGHVAVLLDPTPALAYGITWTGTLLAAAKSSGLLLLQDILCLHSLNTDNAGQAEGPASVTLQHRVILVLGTARARHAER